MTDETPRLSYSIAKVLLSCPAKAYLEHRKLGNQRKEPTPAMDRGTVIERMITGAEDGVAVIHANNFQPKAAQEARDAAKSDGRIPMLAREYEDLLVAAEKLTPQVFGALGGFAGWQFQQRHEWESSGCACSGSIDAVRVDADSYAIADFKSAADASPDACQRAKEKYGYDIQHAAYIDAIETAHPQLAGRGSFLFIFFELSPPYCVTPVQLDGLSSDLGRRKWARAKQVWTECLSRDEWPGYLPPGEVFTATAKPWELEKFTNEPPRDEEGNLTHEDITFC